MESQKSIKNISSQKFLLLAHYATFAYQDMLYDYLIENKATLVTKMNFPLPELPYLRHLEIIHNIFGKYVVKEVKTSFYRPPLVAYIFQSLQLFYEVYKSKKVYDVVIAQDSLLAFLSIYLKKTGKVKKIIFYSHGLDKTRFSYDFLNKLYSWIDKTSAKNADFNWFLSKKMGEIRKSQNISESKLFWIPSSIPIKSVARKTKVENQKIVFLGTVDKKNGADILSEMIDKVIGKIPDASLDIMGNGSYFKELKRDLKKLKLESKVRLHGQLKFKEFSPKLTNFAVGIAPYAYSEDNLTPLSDSLKMRIYLAAGLPVVITKGFHFSDEITKHNLGEAVESNATSFANALVTLLENKNLNNETRKRALAYSKEYDLTSFYREAFKRVFQGN